MPTEGFKELSHQLHNMGQALGGKAFRNAAMRSMLPALHAARAAAPVGEDYYIGPYSGVSRKTGRAWSKNYVTPYPRRTYKGRLVLPGFTRRSIRRKSLISKDKRYVTVLLGVEEEAWAGLMFTELGNSRTPARPWLEPAFKAALPSVDRKFRSILKANIDKAARNKRAAA